MSTVLPGKVGGPAFGALAGLLTEMAHVVAQLTPDEFTASGVPGISGHIGGHVRHCLDHVRALEQGLECGLMDYEARRQDTMVEHDRKDAVLSLMAAASRLDEIEDAALARRVVVRSLIATDGRLVEASSSVGRELAFVISHTIHHNAQIALLVHRLGTIRLPQRFGMAPGTRVLVGAA